MEDMREILTMGYRINKYSRTMTRRRGWLLPMLRNKVRKRAYEREYKRLYKERMKTYQIEFDRLMDKASSTKARRKRSRDKPPCELKDMKELPCNDELFHLTLDQVSGIYQCIRQLKTPTPETFRRWDKYAVSFYLKMCTCFRVDYQHLEATNKDELLQSFQEQEVHSGVNQPCPTDSEEEEELSPEEMDNLEFDLAREELRGPYKFGSYSPLSAPDRIPYHLYLLVKEAALIMMSPQVGNPDCLKDLICVEDKIRFFCTYFHAHLPTGWTYNRYDAPRLVACYDTNRKPRYRMEGYTPISSAPLEELEILEYDEETLLPRSTLLDVLGIIHSRQTPKFYELGLHCLYFYCKVCGCFGIDYRRLETASEDDVCLMYTGRPLRAL